MFYVFVISQPIELKFDSELEDIYRSLIIGKKKKKKKKKKYSVECLCVSRVFDEVKHRSHPPSY